MHLQIHAPDHAKQKQNRKKKRFILVQSGIHHRLQTSKQEMVITASVYLFDKQSLNNTIPSYYIKSDLYSFFSSSLFNLKSVFSKALVHTNGMLYLLETIEIVQIETNIPIHAPKLMHTLVSIRITLHLYAFIVPQLETSS